MIVSLPHNTADQSFLFPWRRCLPEPGIFAPRNRTSAGGQCKPIKRDGYNFTFELIA